MHNLEATEVKFEIGRSDDDGEYDRCNQQWYPRTLNARMGLHSMFGGAYKAVAGRWSADTSNKFQKDVPTGFGLVTAEQEESQKWETINN